MKAVNLPLFKRRLQEIARELYRENGWDMPAGFERKDERDRDTFDQVEAAQAKSAQRDPKALKKMFREVWERSDSRAAFGAALRENGFELALGSRRAFVAIDAEGKAHSLSRWTGAGAAALRARFGAPDGLPSIEEARQRLTPTNQSPLRADKALEEMVARHHAERARLMEAQRSAVEQARRNRQAQLPRGLIASWAKLTGQLQRLIAKLEAEATEEKAANQRALDDLIAKHLRERRTYRAKDLLRQAVEDLWAQAAPRKDHRQHLVLPEVDPLPSQLAVEFRPEVILDQISQKQAVFEQDDIDRVLRAISSDATWRQSVTKRLAEAVIYCRVSSRAQETLGHGLESQETRCRQYCDAKGLDVAAVFPDTITGGGDYLQRPGMVALLSFIDAQPDTRFVVVVDDLKRASRDTRAFLDLRDAFRRRGVPLECLNMKLGETPEDEFIETIMAAQGALERKQNGRQVAQKMKARMQSGYWIHNPPAGYHYETLKGHGKVLVFEEPLASIVRQGFEGYATGRFATQAEVKRFFESHPAFPRNSKGIITQQRVTDILKQPLYTGHICSENYGISWLKGHHEPLISIETFEKVQARRAGVAKAPTRANLGEDVVLRVIAACSSCGTPLRSSWSTGATKRYAYCLCQTKTCEAYGKSIPRDKIEDDVGALLKKLAPTENVIALAKAMFRQAWDQRVTHARTAVASAKSQLTSIDKQIDGLLTRVLDATNATVIWSYESKISALEKEKATLADQLAHHAEPTRDFDEKLELTLRFLANPWKLWENGNNTLLRIVLKLAFAGRVTYCRNKGARTLEMALPFKALGGLEGKQVCFGAAEGTRTPDPIITNFAVHELDVTVRNRLKSSKPLRLNHYFENQTWTVLDGVGERLTNIPY